MPASDFSPDEFDNDDLLEELTLQAKAAKAEQQNLETKAREETNRHRTALLKRIQALYGYFRKLKETLEVLEPALSADYVFPHVGQVTGLRQGDYRLHSPEAGEKSSEFTFQYHYGDDAAFEIRVNDRISAQNCKDLLWSYQLRFTTKELTNGGSLFKVERRIPVSFTFAVDDKRGQILLTIKNLDRLGPRTNHLDLKDANPTLARELAKCVLHKPNRLEHLTGDALSNTGLIRIRSQLQNEVEETEREIVVEPNEARRGRWSLRRR